MWNVIRLLERFTDRWFIGMLCKPCSFVALLFNCYLTRLVALGEKLQRNRRKVTQIHTHTFSHAAGCRFFLLSSGFQALKQQQQRNQRRQGGMPTTSSPRLLLKTIKEMADINTKPGRSHLLLWKLAHSDRLTGRRFSPQQKNQRGFTGGLQPHTKEK